MLPDDKDLETDFNATPDIGKGVQENEDLSKEKIESKDRQNAYFLRESLSRLLKNLLESEWVLFFLEATIGFLCLCIIFIIGGATYCLINDFAKLFSFLNSAVLTALIGLSAAFITSKFSKK